MDLCYLRDVYGREVDFVVLKNKKPLFAVECKLNNADLSAAIKYFKIRTNIPNLYQVRIGTDDYLHIDAECRVLPFHKFSVEAQLV